MNLTKILSNDIVFQCSKNCLMLFPHALNFLYAQRLLHVLLHLPAQIVPYAQNVLMCLCSRFMDCPVLSSFTSCQDSSGRNIKKSQRTNHNYSKNYDYLIKAGFDPDDFLKSYNIIYNEEE